MEIEYSEADYPLQKETFELIGICMEVHRQLGRGFLEIVYKDAIEYELRKRGVAYKREVEYSVPYKDIVLPHKFYADFVVGGNIILEIKSQNGIHEQYEAQILNYLAVSKCKIGLVINYGHHSLKFRRYML